MPSLVRGVVGHPGGYPQKTHPHIVGPCIAPNLRGYIGPAYADEVELLVEVIDEIYETFVISAMLAGKISAPDFWNQKEVYFAHKWVKPPKPWIDPAKEATAVMTALKTGQKTFKQVAAENGADWRDQIDDIAEVLQYAQDEYGLDLGGMIFGQAMQPAAEGDGPGGEDDTAKDDGDGAEPDTDDDAGDGDADDKGGRGGKQ